jgi:hypothetical protein
MGGELYVFAKQHKICKLANWSRQSNITITSCSLDSAHATEKQAKQLNIHMQGESNT